MATHAAESKCENPNDHVAKESEGSIYDSIGDRPRHPKRNREDTVVKNAQDVPSQKFGQAEQRNHRRQRRNLWQGGDLEAQRLMQVQQPQSSQSLEEVRTSEAQRQEHAEGQQPEAILTSAQAVSVVRLPKHLLLSNFPKHGSSKRTRTLVKAPLIVPELTSVFQGAGLWSEGSMSFSYPRRDFARRYPSFQKSSGGMFYLSGQDGNEFYLHLIQNPNLFPFGPAPVVNNPLPGQFLNLTLRFAALLRAHNIQGRDLGSYGGVGIHGTLQQFRYAVENGLHPQQYATLSSKSSVGPPPDQERYEVRVNKQISQLDFVSQSLGRHAAFPAASTNADDAHFMTDDPDVQDNCSTQQYEETEGREEHENAVEDIISTDDNSNEDKVGNVRDWVEKDPRAWEYYRRNYPNHEALRCDRCRRLRYGCSFMEGHFPCGRCIDDKTVCMRQYWGPKSRTRKNPPKFEQPGKRSLIVRKGKKGQASQKMPSKKAAVPAAGPASTVSIIRCTMCYSRGYSCDPGRPCRKCLHDNQYCINPLSSAPQAAASITPQQIQNSRCDRCWRYNLECDTGRPCQSCLDVGDSVCMDSNRQDRPSQENLPDDGPGRGNRVHVFAEMDSELALLQLPSQPASVQSTAQSVIDEGPPGEVSSVPGHSKALNSRPRSAQTHGKILPRNPKRVAGDKRSAPNDEDDNDDVHDDAVANKRQLKKAKGPSGRPRGRPKGTKAAKETKTAAKDSS